MMLSYGVMLSPPRGGAHWHGLLDQHAAYPDAVLLQCAHHVGAPVQAHQLGAAARQRRTKNTAHGTGADQRNFHDLG